MTSCTLVIAALSAARSVVVLVAVLVSVLVADFEGEHASTSKRADTPREARVWIMSPPQKRLQESAGATPWFQYAGLLREWLVIGPTTVPTLSPGSTRTPIPSRFGCVPAAS